MVHAEDGLVRLFHVVSQASVLGDHCRYPHKFPQACSPMSRQDTVDAVARISDFDIDEDDDLTIAQDIIQSFGVVRQDANAHQRSVRFLLACLNRYLWTWESLGCEPPGPIPATEAVESWLQTGTFANDFAKFCLPVTPIRQGAPSKIAMNPL